MQYKINSINIFVEVFTKMTAIINFIIVAYFFEAIYCHILEYLFIAHSKDKELFDHISTYFSIVKING